MPRIDVYRVMASAAIKPLAQMLGRSLYTSPYYLYLCPDDSQRRRCLPAWMTFMLTYGLRYGAVYAAEDGLGAAIWSGPEKPHLPFSHLLASGLLPGVWRMGPAAWQRLLALNEQYEKIHHREAVPHWYLLLLGVEPREQGKGIGGALLEPVLSKADASGHPCWLETTTEQNVRFYQKRGFEVVAMGGLGVDDGYWCMRRQPLQGPKGQWMKRLENE